MCGHISLPIMNNQETKNARLQLPVLILRTPSLHWFRCVAWDSCCGYQRRKLVVHVQIRQGRQLLLPLQTIFCQVKQQESNAARQNLSGKVIVHGGCNGNETATMMSLITVTVFDDSHIHFVPAFTFNLRWFLKEGMMIWKKANNSAGDCNDMSVINATVFRWKSYSRRTLSSLSLCNDSWK